ncbi:uncharacterized protein LOC114317035 [Camellia sinensis]|uniref:uncharacterized protein LOC114317035 n=1 Tax=Camellia sinensis TaxID=4442 RepID=UPI0010364F3C|nr:uncharacterized protein LOC114317035 [Camellia sinensis]
MHELSTVDGFVEVTESLAEMIKYVANEPSVGLFYVQQHTQNAVPNLINLKNNVMEKSWGLTLHTKDLEDSIAMVRSMKDCGFPIADEMIGDIKKSLAIMGNRYVKDMHSIYTSNSNLNRLCDEVTTKIPIKLLIHFSMDIAFVDIAQA